MNADQNSVGKTLGETITALRERGDSKVQCVAVLVASGLSQIEAKRLVHDDPAWADAKWHDENIFEERPE
jgi:hypothetical protein